MSINFEQELTEAFSNVSFMDVSEIRTLYYGRLNMYVSFTDDWEINHDGMDGSELIRPYGIECHTVDTLVGRKVSTPLFYAYVMRFNPKRGFVNDISNYSADQYKEDIEIIETLDYIKDSVKLQALSQVEAGVRYRSYFERLWDLTRRLADQSRYKDKLWRRILLDLGYTGFNDPKGKGILSETKSPVTLIIDFSDVEKYDIVPVQKYRTDKRRYVTDKVKRENRKMWVARNRVAKRRTDKFRTDKKKETFKLLTKKDLENIRLLSGGL